MDNPHFAHYLGTNHEDFSDLMYVRMPYEEQRRLFEDLVETDLGLILCSCDAVISKNPHSEKHSYVTGHIDVYGRTSSEAVRSVTEHGIDYTPFEFLFCNLDSFNSINRHFEKRIFDEFPFEHIFLNINFIEPADANENFRFNLFNTRGFPKDIAAINIYARSLVFLDRNV